MHPVLACLPHSLLFASVFEDFLVWRCISAWTSWLHLLFASVFDAFFVWRCIFLSGAGFFCIIYWRNLGLKMRIFLAGRGNLIFVNRGCVFFKSMHLQMAIQQNIRCILSWIQVNFSKNASHYSGFQNRRCVICILVFQFLYFLCPPKKSASWNMNLAIFLCSNLTQPTKWFRPEQKSQ